jgi:hypothetical protein
MYEHYNYSVFTENLIDYFMEKQYHNSENYFLFKELNLNEINILLLSRIESDNEFPDYFWGKYLFEFKINDKTVIPIFDSCVDYTIDKGHLFHNVIKSNETEYTIVFTIRHLINNTPEFIYKMYSSKTSDFITFTNTCEISSVNELNDTKWYSYPSIFNHNEEFYAVSNQDEFGKSKNVLLFNVEI